MSRTYGKMELIDGHWIIKADPHVVLRAKRVFAKLDKWESNTLSLKDTPENCRDLQWFTERYPLEIADRHRSAINRGAKAFNENILRLEQIVGESYAAPKVEMSRPAREYQSRAAHLLLAQGNLLLCDDLGLGKSCSAIATFTDPRTLPAAVVVYPHLQRQWQHEIAKFLPRLTTHIVKKSEPYELPQFMGRGPDVLILTYHKLAGWAPVIQTYCKSIIFDEVQELRKSTSGKYQAAKQICDALPFRMGLTATPIYNYGGEMYSILNCLKPDCLGTFEEFTREWGVGYDRDKVRVKDPAAFGTYLRENYLMIRRTRKQVGRELPDVIRIPHRIDANTKALDNIKDAAGVLARTILANTQEFRGQKMQAAEEFSNLLRQATGIAKAPFVADFVNMLLESEEKVILCGWHRAVYEIWKSRLALAGVKFECYTGTESANQKENAKAAFIHGDTRVLMLSLRAGAGLNELQTVCRTIVFGELDWSPGVHEQCIGRLHRDGQNDPVTAYFLISDEGADPIMSDVLGVKSFQSETIRDPDGEMIQQLDRGDNNIRRLAETYLKGKR